MKPTNEQIEAWLKSDNSWSELIVVAYAAGAAAMKERCAKVCEIEASVVVVNAPEEYQAGREMGATACAAAIRALGDDE